MPNWCQNEVSITAHKGRGEAEGFVNYVLERSEISGDVTNYFSFNKIIPMPDELRGTTSPTKIVSQEQYDTARDLDLSITQEMSDSLKSKYGWDNWYDWAIRNWGVKWNTDCDTFEIDDFGGLEYKFETAWGPPTRIYIHLVAQFPELDISWVYKEEGSRMAGWL